MIKNSSVIFFDDEEKNIRIKYYFKHDAYKNILAAFMKKQSEDDDFQYAMKVFVRSNF